MSFDLIKRRQFICSVAAGGLYSLAGLERLCEASEGHSNKPKTSTVSVEELPALEGELSLYLGRGEGGLYEKVIDAIRKRNPKLTLRIRRGPTATLANTIVAEAKAGVLKADMFWAVDSGAIALVANTKKAKVLPSSLTELVHPRFRKKSWIPISGRIRSIPYHNASLSAQELPSDVMAIAKSKYKIGWAPAYGAFQSFITAMRVTEGNKATAAWLRDIKPRATNYAGELGVAMAVSRGEVDLGFANHYYTLRLKKGDPSAKIDLAFTKNDAGCLLNASGAMVLGGGELAMNFVRYLLTREVQSYLSEEAYEIPMITEAPMPAGLPSLESIHPPEIDLDKLANLQPSLDLMRKAGVL